MPVPKKHIDHTTVVKRFGARLREVRQSRGMTQGQLAEKADVSQAYVGRLERGGAAPGIDLVARLAAALGTTVADLFPEPAEADPATVLRGQARTLFDALIKSNDTGTLSLLAQFLARLSETAASGE